MKIQAKDTTKIFLNDDRERRGGRERERERERERDNERQRQRGRKIDR